MEKLGWLGSDVWFAHGIHFSAEELHLLAQTGTGVAHCPASNMKLASGVARVPEMLALGVPVGLAVDGSASNDGSNLASEMRTAYLLHRLTYGEQAPSGYEVLKLATRGSAKVLGRDDIGHLAPGMAADLFAVREDRLAFAGATGDVSAMLATVGLSAPVDFTLVQGKTIVWDGRLTGADETRLAERVSREARAMIQ